MIKKLVILGMLLGSVNTAHAACLADSGICWESGQTSITALKATLQTMTTMQLEAYTPGGAGELVYLTGVAGFPICVSTGTGAGAFVVIASTANSALSLKHCN